MSEPTPLILRIQNILDLPPTNSTDALTGFDKIATLNELFPDEASLARVNEVQTQINQDIIQIQQEIDGLRAELRRDQEPARMQLIQELIAELLAQMSRIREKAAESEAIVRDITKDIQVLDLAKKNLALSMTALKRFQMLVNALGQLDSLVKGKKYGEIAQTLAAVKEIALFFKTYSSIERIAVATRRLQELQGLVRTSVERDFDDFFLQDPARPVKASTISDACQVVDVLGDDVKNSILDRYSSLELKEYRRIFRSTDEAGQLDNISRRFAYFRRVLTAHDAERARAFPQAWRVGEHLTAHFASATRADVVVALQSASDKANSLGGAGSGTKPKTGLGLGIGTKEREKEKAAMSANVPALTVSLLLEALKETLDFENNMERKFGISFRELVERVPVPGHHGTGQTISSAFDSHMGLFVDAQDRIIADLLVAHRGVNARISLEASSPPNAQIDPDAPPPSVLPSSTELFIAIAQGMEDCTRLLGGKIGETNNGVMAQMRMMHKKWLKVYAEDVLIAATKKSDKERKSFEGRFNLAELQKLCLILNTADYCQTTTMQLEEKMRDKVGNEESEEISLQDEQDLFVQVISTCISHMLRELDSATEPIFTTLLKFNWGSIENVSGTSAWASDLATSLETLGEVIHAKIEPKKYVRSFCDKASNVLITKFTNALVKSRPIKGLGGEQLLLDLQSFKSTLLKIPGPTSTAESTYGRNVSKSISRLETLLKVIITPVDPAEAFVLNYILLIGDSSFSNFQKVLDLKGTPKTEQNTLLDTLLTITSTRTELASESFLTTLDMDPTPGAGVGVMLGNTPPTGADSPRGADTPRREVFSDLRKLVSFTMRRERDRTSSGAF
ncbi:vacuolar protein sorting-associated protein 53 [Ceratobasidium sp. AG-Ba]|nr:vacuolar protein sorting-associated protein 53 [Ceratobasidium sp. AG-Ba]